METGIHPVESIWEQLAYRYLIRLNEKPWNPAYDTVQQLIKATAKWKHNSTPAAIIYLRKLDQTTKTLFKFPVFRHGNTFPPNTSLLRKKKHSTQLEQPKSSCPLLHYKTPTT
jgi:hypothetical protein